MCCSLSPEKWWEVLCGKSASQSCKGASLCCPKRLEKTDVCVMRGLGSFLGTRRKNSCQTLQPYVQLRRFGGHPRGGFGLGIERFLMFVTGLSNVRDLIPFPRTPEAAFF